MRRSELVILVAFVLVGCAAFALESAGAETARIVGIAFGISLLFLLVLGLVFRARAKKRRALAPPTPSEFQELRMSAEAREGESTDPTAHP